MVNNGGWGGVSQCGEVGKGLVGEEGLNDLWKVRALVYCDFPCNTNMV